MGGSLLGRDLRSIAVFMLRHIGDTLLSTPTFHALRAGFPSARTLAVVNEGTQEMLEGNPDIDGILVFHRRRRNEGGFGRWKEETALVRSLRVFGIRPADLYAADTFLKYSNLPEILGALYEEPS